MAKLNLTKLPLVTDEVSKQLSQLPPSQKPYIMCYCCKILEILVYKAILGYKIKSAVGSALHGEEYWKLRPKKPSWAISWLTEMWRSDSTTPSIYWLITCFSTKCKLLSGTIAAKLSRHMSQHRRALKTTPEDQSNSYWSWAIPQDSETW